MEPENLNQEALPVEQPQSSQFNQVTPLSKYLAMVLFAILPFVGGYIGYMFAPEKVVEVERVVVNTQPTSTESIQPTDTPFQDWTVYTDEISDMSFNHPNDWDCNTRNFNVQGSDSIYIQCKSNGYIVLDIAQSNFPDGDYSDFTEQPEQTMVTENYTRTTRIQSEAGLGLTAVVLYNFEYQNNNYSAFIPYKHQNGWSHDYYQSKESAISMIEQVVESIFN